MKILFIEAVTNFGGARMASVELAAELKNFHDVNIVDINGGKCKEFIDACVNKDVKYFTISTRKKSISNTKNIIFKTLHFLRETRNYYKDRNTINDFVDSIKPDYIILNCFRTLSYFYFSKNKFSIVYYSHVWSLKRKSHKSTFTY